MDSQESLAIAVKGQPGAVITPTEVGPPGKGTVAREERS